MRKRKLPDGMVTRPDSPGYHAAFRFKGQRIRQFLSTDYDMACRILTQLRARVEAAHNGLLNNEMSLAEIREQYIAAKRQKLRPSSVTRYNLSLDTILPHLNATRASHLTLAKVVKYRELRLEQGVSPRSINHDTTVLNAMLNWAVKPGKLIATNPISGLEPLPHENPVERRPLAKEEVDALLAAAHEPWRTIWYAYLVTGMRYDELASLEWPDVDLELRSITIRAHRAKGRKERVIPLDDDLYVRLVALKDAVKDRKPGSFANHAETDAKIKQHFTRKHVFVTTQNTRIGHRNLYRRFLADCAKAGINTKGQPEEGIGKVDIHSLRLTFATDLIENGADPKSVQELLGHSTLALTMKLYAKVRGGAKVMAVAKLSYGAGATPAGFGVVTQAG